MEDHFIYIINSESITCIDDNFYNNEYWIEDFSLEDYKYVDKWLKGEIEYDEYLKIKNSNGEIQI